ncbi:MAG: efflux RND transporter permease subunit, partial [Campylobacterota bacterium]|nr:efflux RND transporter permease subunit [Campylobacterota bacterium]
KFQLFPEFDTTQIYVYGKVNINNELSDTEKIVTSLEKKLLQNSYKSEISSITSVTGFKMDAKNRAELGENLFHIFIDLHERKPSNLFDRYISPYLSLEYDESLLKRDSSAKEIAKHIQELMIPFHTQTDKMGLTFDELVVKVPGAGVVASDIEISLSGKNEQEILKGIKIVENSLNSITGVKDISNDATIGEKELKLRVNKYGQELGFNEAVISQALMPYYLKGEYGKMFNDDGLLRLKIESKANKNINSIQKVELQIPNTNQYIALKDICDFIVIQGFVTLNKEDAVRIRTIFASLNKEIITSSEVMQKMQTTFNELKESGYRVDIKGEEQENNKNRSEMMQAGLISIFLIFITLVWLFDSIKKPLIVISTIPLVLLGVFVGHIIMGINLSMPGLIGIVGLSGVVVNDGLIMVSFIQKANDTEELMRKALTRLRPILLTSLTTVLGLLTLIFFASGQALILQPMAISLGFGIAWATVLNLIYVPLLFSVIYNIKPQIKDTDDFRNNKSRVRRENTSSKTDTRISH